MIIRGHCLGQFLFLEQRCQNLFLFLVKNVGVLTSKIPRIDTVIVSCLCFCLPVSVLRVCQGFLGLLLMGECPGVALEMIPHPLLLPSYSATHHTCLKRGRSVRTGPPLAPTSFQDLAEESLPRSRSGFSEAPWRG